MPPMVTPGNGGGFRTDLFPGAHKSIWDLRSIFAESRHIFDVRLVGRPHPGLIGCAPSQAPLDTWHRHEADLVVANRTRVPPLASLPTAQDAVLGGLRAGPAFDRVAAEGARTSPPREHGGNCDIKNPSRCTRVYSPVYVRGANLSMGDPHFAQGDREIAFCGQREMAGWIHLQVDLIKDGMAGYGVLP